RMRPSLQGRTQNHHGRSPRATGVLIKRRQVCFNMRKPHHTGITAALISSLFLGLAPVFGKAAMGFGRFSPLAVVALRTSLAALLLVAIIAIFRRKILYIYPAGLLGCVLAGTVNGIG